jgi:hypothetical protein
MSTYYYTPEPSSEHIPVIPVRAFINERKLRLIFTDPKLRPPVLEEMQPDIDRLAASIARMRSDQTCYALGVEDLIAECKMKLAVIITKKKFEVLPNRFEAFKYIKTVFSNHVKSLVSKHRLTLKRGYQKPDEERIDDKEISLNSLPAVSVKNTDLSADDPDQHMQLADPGSGWSSEDSFIEDVATFMTPVELLVLKQFNLPNDRTRFFAELDASVGRMPDSGRAPVISFSEKNHADGLGLELSQFKKILRSLRDKLSWLKMNEANPNEIAWNRAIARLEELFEVQIPQSIERHVVRRLLTIAAVDQYEKIENNKQALEDLQTIGAKIPERRAGVTSCFGIMYHRNNRTCIACGLNRNCREEAMNHGLGDIDLDSRLLGAKQFRVPHVVANSPEPLPILNERDEEIYSYLSQNFNKSLGSGEWVFKHKDVGGISVTVQTSPTFEIKVLKPSVTLMTKLTKTVNSYFIPSNISADEAIKLLGQHAHEAFVATTA